MTRREAEIKAVGFFVYDDGPEFTNEDQLKLLEAVETSQQYVDNVNYAEPWEHYNSKNLLREINLIATMLEEAYQDGMLKGAENLEVQEPQIISSRTKIVLHFKTFNIGKYFYRCEKGVVQLGDHFIWENGKEVLRGSGFTKDDWKVWFSDEPGVNEHVIGRTPSNIKSHQTINKEDET